MISGKFDYVYNKLGIITGKFDQMYIKLGISRKTQSVPPARKDTWLSVSFYCAIL